MNVNSISKVSELQNRINDISNDANSAVQSYSEVLRAAKNRNYPNNEPEDFWTLRHKRLEKMLEMQQEMFDHIYELKQLSNHKAEIKSAQMKAEGLVDTSNPMPVITGVPAKYLLSMLTAD